MAEKQQFLGDIPPRAPKQERKEQTTEKSSLAESPAPSSTHSHLSSHELKKETSHPTESKHSPKLKIENINEGDFVEIEYTGRLKEDEFVFDTTDEKIAKKSGSHNPKMEYGPLTICIGQGNVLAGLEQALIGKETGKKYTIPITPEQGFGKKSAKLVELIPTNKFKKDRVQPMPGLQVNIDGRIGTIKTVSGGRTLVDFNHPLSGKDLVYEVKVFNKITDPRKKIGSILRMQLNMKNFFVEVKNDKANIGLKEKMRLPEPLLSPLKKMITELVPEVKEIEFKEDKPEKKEAKSSEKPAKKEEMPTE